MTAPHPTGGNQTTLHRLLETKLGKSLDGYIAARREAGSTYIAIAEDLRQATDVYVTHESIRRWHMRNQPESDVA